MSAGIQMALVALLLAWSLWVMLRRWVPATLLNRWADRAGVLGWRHLAAWLRPAAAAPGNCDSNCSRCQTGCSSAPAEQPVQWRQPPSSGGCH